MSNEFGPQTYQIKKVLERFKTLTPAQIKSLDASWDASWAASRVASWDASRDASWDASWAMRGAVEALHSRDLIGNKFTQAHYDYLVLPWRQIVGEFEEPPTVESLEKRVDVLEKSVKYGLHTHIPVISAVSIFEINSQSGDFEYLSRDLENKKTRFRNEAIAKLNTKNRQNAEEYQNEKKRIEEMR